MLHDDRNEFSKRKKVNKKSELKQCDICEFGIF